MRLDVVNKLVYPPARAIVVAPPHELDHVRVHDAVPQRRAFVRVRDASGQLGPHLAQQVAQARLGGPDQSSYALTQPSGERRAFPRCRDGDRDVSLPVDRGRDEAAVVQIVHGIQEDALPLSLGPRSEEHTSELQSRLHLVCRLLLEKKKYLPSRVYGQYNLE